MTKAHAIKLLKKQAGTFGKKHSFYEGLKHAIKVLEGVEETKQSIVIPFTINDCEELREGGHFDWCFSTDQGEEIDLEIVLQDD